MEQQFKAWSNSVSGIAIVQCQSARRGTLMVLGVIRDEDPRYLLKGLLHTRLAGAGRSLSISVTHSRRQCCAQQPGGQGRLGQGRRRER